MVRALTARYNDLQRIGGEPFEGDSATTAFDVAGTSGVELTGRNDPGEEATTAATVTVEEADDPETGEEPAADEETADEEEAGDTSGDGLPAFGMPVPIVALLSNVSLRPTGSSRRSILERGERVEIDHVEDDDRDRDDDVAERDALEPDGGDDDRFGDRTLGQEQPGTEKHECGSVQRGPAEGTRPLADVEVSDARTAHGKEVRRPRFHTPPES